MRREGNSPRRRRGSGSVTRRVRPAAAAAFALIAAVVLQTGFARADESIDSVFARFDGNGDGTIDRTEFDLNKILVIVALDRNSNDHLDPDEVKMSAENFAAIDTDGDGKISGFEFVESPFGKFESFDEDGDGLVTREAFEAYVERLRN